MAILGVLAATAAHAIDYKVLADRKVNFDAYKTFRFDKVTITRASGAKVKAANIDKLRDAVAERLLKEGLVEDTKKADLVVTVTAGSEAALSREETQGVPYFDGAWRILPKEHGAAQEAAPGVPEYSQASLRVDLKDRKTGAVVWRALGADLVRLPVSQQIIADALAKAFEQYPPPAAE